MAQQRRGGFKRRKKVDYTTDSETDSRLNPAEQAKFDQIVPYFLAIFLHRSIAAEW